MFVSFMQTNRAVIKILIKWILQVLITRKNVLGGKIYIHSKSCLKTNSRRPCIGTYMDQKKMIRENDSDWQKLIMSMLNNLLRTWKNWIILPFRVQPEIFAFFPSFNCPVFSVPPCCHFSHDIWAILFLF